MSDILVLGALHHDVVVDAPRLPALDETLPGSSVDYRFGGKGGNQAVAAARMGARVSMAGRIGRDPSARSILAALDAAGVDRSLVLEASGPTGMSVAITLPSGEYGAVIVSGANLENDGRVSWRRPPGTVVIQNEIPSEANLAFVRSLSGDTCLIFNAAPTREIPQAVLARTDVLVVNRGEAAALSGCTSPKDSVGVLAGKVRGAVVLTMGGDGLIWSAEGKTGAMSAHPVAAVSAHGAGDMFVGAVAARLEAGAALTEALEFARAAAALFVSSPVASRKNVDARAVEQFLDR